MRALLLCIALLGCKQSLFDSHGGDDDDTNKGDGGGSNLASTCPAPCLGDAGADFDGTGAGSNGHWAYLEDHENRTWTPMTAGDPSVGATSGNAVTSCGKMSAATCSQLPGALLVSTAGSTSATTAVEYTAPMARVVQVQLGIRLPDGAPSQTVRLYRGSREDALYQATADPGVTVTQTVTLDVLANERIYVTMDGGAVDKAAVQLFVVGDTATFPSECVVALPFEMNGANACGTPAFTYTNFDTSMDAAPTLVAGPYAEEGMGASIAAPSYFHIPDPIARTGDFTLQFWMKFNGVVDTDTGGWPYSDLDLNSGGGLGMVLFIDAMTSHLAAEISSCTDPNSNPLGFDYLDVQYPDDKAWHFVRLVYKGTTVTMCLDGTKLGAQAFSKPLTTTFGPTLGKNVVWTPSEPAFNGTLDDLRVISTALPCN
ncbi:MAG: hypothetical protein QM831_33105 [Kofleriaceae bacterium]